MAMITATRMATATNITTTITIITTRTTRTLRPSAAARRSSPTACCSSRTSAIWCARRCGISARTRRFAILSVTEGEDKPLKYPDMFAAARLMIVNKTDLLPYVQFDVERCIEYARRINPALDVICVSATTGDGIDAWLDWVLRTGDAHDPLAARIGELEAELAALRAQQRRAGDAA